MSAKQQRPRARSQRSTRSSLGGRVPRSPARLEALFERYSLVKRMLVAYVRAHRGEAIHECAARYRETGTDAESSLILATEDELHERLKDGAGGRHVIDLFLADQPGLDAADRRMARQWKDVRRGLFRIDRREGRRARMRNLVDDLDYQVLISGGDASDLETFAPGDYLSAAIVPLMNAWTLSGTQTMLGALDARVAYGTAAKIAMRLPAEYFRNPRHLDLGRESSRWYHERFVRIFGRSWVVGTAREIEDAHCRFVVENNQLSVAEGKATAADLTGIQHALELPAELHSAESVGMLCHSEQGLLFLAESQLFLESFTDPARAGEAENRGRVLKYLDDDSIPPWVFELVAGADPNQASETMRRVLGDPSFDWRLDGDRLLREHKPSHFERPPLPSVLALSRDMLAGLRFLDASKTSAGSLT